ncbi:MAG: UTP--glucose-1-phosphate uridylyltransferase GalU [Acidimicrobiia bacterium]
MMKVHKAVIPAAGLGTRFLPATKTVPKEMLPVVDKPAIQYVVEEAVRAGIDDILVITGRGKESLEDHFDTSVELEHELEARGKTAELAAVRAIADLAQIHFVRQGKPLGLGHAIGTARRHVGNEPFAVLLPDDIFHSRSGVLEGMLDAAGAHEAPVLALKRMSAAEISAYGCASVKSELEENLVSISALVEKPSPEEAPSDLAVLGRYVFTPDIFEAIDETKPGAGGEIQITDAIALLLGEREVLGYIFDWGRYDAGNKVDYLRATVELALERDDIGPAFEQVLSRIVRERDL